MAFVTYIARDHTQITPRVIPCDVLGRSIELPPTSHAHRFCGATGSNAQNRG